MRYLLIILILLLTVNASAQFGPPIASTEAMNTFSSGPVPSGQNFALQRARNIYDDEDDYYEEDYKIEQIFIYKPQTITKIFNAVKGQTIIDAVTQETLDSPVRIKITKEEKENYSDDGITKGDFIENDEIFSNVLPTNSTEFMGGPTFRSLKLNIKLLQAVQNADPLDFFGKNFIEANEYRSKIQEKNRKLESWGLKFANPYRTSKNNHNSQFYTLYIPQPPTPPSIPPPDIKWWRPFNSTDTVWDLTVDNFLDVNKITDYEKRKKAAEELNKQASADPLFKQQTIIDFGPPPSVINLLEPNTQQTLSDLPYQDEYDEDDDES